MTAADLHLVKSVLQETNSESEPPADLVERYLRRFVAMTDAQAAVVALWVLHTHVLDAAEATPYLGITSAEMRSGKTRLLEVLELLVARPLRSAGTSQAAMFRLLEEMRPTLMFDEVDAIFGPKTARENEDIRKLLNLGYRRGALTQRCVGEGSKMRVEHFDAFGAKALAGIGELPRTIADRTVPIRLKRRAPDESVERFRHREAIHQSTPIREALERWAEINVHELRDARPDLPDELDDRGQDVCEPLLAIADLLGGQWPARARGAVVELRSTTPDEITIGIRLLTDIRSIFNSRDAEQIATADLLEELHRDEEAPWNGHLDSRRLARRLRSYDVRSRTIRIGASTPRGYRREDFEDAWRRYLEPLPAPLEGV